MVSKVESSYLTLLSHLPGRKLGCLGIVPWISGWMKVYLLIGTLCHFCTYTDSHMYMYAQAGYRGEWTRRGHLHCSYVSSLHGHVPIQGPYISHSHGRCSHSPPSFISIFLQHTHIKESEAFDVFLPILHMKGCEFYWFTETEGETNSHTRNSREQIYAFPQQVLTLTDIQTSFLSHGPCM
jgi:hypothetical protein